MREGARSIFVLGRTSSDSGRSFCKSLGSVPKASVELTKILRAFAHAHTRGPSVRLSARYYAGPRKICCRSVGLLMATWMGVMKWRTRHIANPFLQTSRAPKKNVENVKHIFCNHRLDVSYFSILTNLVIFCFDFSSLFYSYSHYLL